jgi:type II secretion system (T2SS) protein E
VDVADLEVGTNRQPRSLGMWAVLTGVVTPEQLQEAYAGWDERGEAPGEMFVRKGWMTEQMVADALGELSGLPVVRAAQLSEDPDVLGALSAEEAWRLEACPLERDDDRHLVVALADPSDARLRALETQLGSDVRPVIVEYSQLKALLDDLQASEDASDDTAHDRKHASENGKVDASDHGKVDASGNGKVDASGNGKVDAEVLHEASGRTAGDKDRKDDATERVEPVTAGIEPDDPATATDQLSRLHERLVSEHVQSTDEIVAYRRQLAELAEEQARLQRSITALEAKLGEGELVLSLIKAKLAEPA